jgi:hypothetical protein
MLEIRGFTLSPNTGIAAMSFVAVLQNLLDRFLHTTWARRKRSILTAAACVVILVLAWMPSIGWAQVGREFVSVEAYVGLARVVHVGKIVELKQTEYAKPQTAIQKLGKPYQMVFEVSETIRGDRTERLELVLALQSTHFLEFMRDHSAEIMLVAGPNKIDHFPNAEIGIEEQGRRLDGQWYQFRLLTPVNVPKSDGGDSVASQLNKRYDACRIFTNELDIVESREMILARARVFAKEHTEMLPAVSLRVPNEFGALCGTPNAFSMITLPMCPSTKETLSAVKNDPSRVMGRVEARNENFERSQMLTSIDKALAMFANIDGM